MGTAMPNKSNRLPTNTTAQSRAEVQLKVVTFSELWSAYPRISPVCKDPATGKAAFSDECAIRVGACLAAVGITNKSFKGARCWFKDHPRAHMLRAEEVANWLQQRPFAGCPKPLDMTGKDWVSKAQGKTGLIFFKDYWLRKGESSPTGDHIDLWNGERLTAVSWRGRVNNFMRFTVGAGALWYSDLANAKRILFWPIS
ncbi:type VI secretion system amidase effector protein Tae4 [Cupriavidus sp.]|uniref:type VI secretion system amidase effector protein Tae4 n=1 Tax=Cupriavidus sp. TaxID=1873897 RepID=UPI0031E1B6E8